MIFSGRSLGIDGFTRSSVQLRAYGQRDPLVEYKKEGLRLFKEMQEAVENQVLTTLAKLEITNTPPPRMKYCKKIKFMFL